MLRLFRVFKVIFFCLLIMMMPLFSFGQSQKEGLKLNQLIEEALQNNPEIMASKKSGKFLGKGATSLVTSTIQVLIIMPVIFAMMKERALRKGRLNADEVEI